ncbi:MULTISPECIES: hypothetical protein [unclassified Nostoc]|uniref:hypothetical protein n=1 Tax=unclassified Nostoc TaxID=2593658 RepID=UPI002AD42EEA|nr:hypothetical protein [Nostoc sp. DedQUE03]MDZ7976133.1 hypothetical protein [Nostoc sp. DedQUE03]MDZ8044109.1 hypothetical protein [Nostoc sp. DedQUE02]
MGVAESRYEFGCRDVAIASLYKDFEITQNYFLYRNQQRRASGVWGAMTVVSITNYADMILEVFSFPFPFSPEARSIGVEIPKYIVKLSITFIYPFKKQEYLLLFG